MFKKLFKKNNDKLVETKHIEPEVTLEDEIKTMSFRLTFKFRDKTTGEITEVEYGDHEAFNKCMGDKNMQVIFE